MSKNCNKCGKCIYQDILNRCLKCKWFYENGIECDDLINNFVEKHIIKEGSREHVISWDNTGRHCSNIHCEINKKGID